MTAARNACTVRWSGRTHISAHKPPVDREAPTQERAGASRAIYLITALHIANGACLRGSRVLLALFAIKLGAGAFEIGLLIALSSVLQLLLGVTAGQASDRYGFRLPMLLGSVGGAISMVLPYLVPSLTGLYVSRALTGLTFIFFVVSAQNLAASIGGPSRRAANLTTFSLGHAIAGLIGPVLVGVAIDRFGYVDSYLLLGALAVLPALALGAFPNITPAPSKPDPSANRGTIVELWRMIPLRRALLTGALVFAASDLLNFYLPIYGHSIGLSASIIGIILGAHSAAAFVVRLVMNRLLRYTTEERLMFWCLLASGLIYLLFPLFQNGWILAAVAFVLGLALGCGQPLAMILIYERAPGGRTGEALGLRMSINKVIQVGVPLAFGYLGSAIGILSVFWSSAVFLLAGSRLARPRTLRRSR